MPGLDHIYGSSGSTTGSTSGSTRANAPPGRSSTGHHPVNQGRPGNLPGGRPNLPSNPMPDPNKARIEREIDALLGATNREPNLNTPYDAGEFAGLEGSQAQSAANEAAALQAKKDKDAKVALAKRLQEQRDERDRKGTTYDPKGGRGTGDKMAADFFGMGQPGDLHAWTDKFGKGHTGTYKEMAASMGNQAAANQYYATMDYGDFGYGPGSQWDEELIQFFGGKPPGGFSHAQLTEYLYGIGAAGIDDSMFLGGGPGQIGFGPGEKPDWYGKPRTGSTGGDGQNDQGGYYGWDGSGGSQGGSGYGYGYGGDDDPLARGYQRAKFAPGTLQEQVNQNYMRLSGLQKKRGGIISLLELR